MKKAINHKRHQNSNRESKSKQAPRRFQIEEETQLLTFLLQALSDKSRSTVKSILSNRQIAVNGTVTTQFDQILNSGDELIVNMEKGAQIFDSPEVKIIYEDDDLIVINKREGLLSVATDNVKDKTAYRILRDYVKQAGEHHKIFILHRLDRETSGLMMFAKSIAIQEQLQKNWKDMIVERKYVAVVEGRPKNSKGEITSNLRENNAMNVYSAKHGQRATTAYEMLKTNEEYSLLELELETGRKNQIRIHMTEMGYPIAGDGKYGATTNPIKRLALHARKLKFIHPTTRQVLDFQTETPKKFLHLVKKGKSQD